MILHHHRKQPGGFYDPTTLRERLWGALGFDFLTVTQRLAQVRREAADWQFWEGEASRRLRDLQMQYTAEKIQP